MRLGLGQPHLVDQPGFASQTSLERTNKLFISHGCEGIGIASP